MPVVGRRLCASAARTVSFSAFVSRCAPHGSAHRDEHPHSRTTRGPSSDQHRRVPPRTARRHLYGWPTAVALVHMPETALPAAVAARPDAPLPLDALTVRLAAAYREPRECRTHRIEGTTAPRRQPGGEGRLVDRAGVASVAGKGAWGCGTAAPGRCGIAFGQDRGASPVRIRTRPCEPVSVCARETSGRRRRCSSTFAGLRLRSIVLRRCRRAAPVLAQPP